MKIKELLKDPKNWTKGVVARNSERLQVGPTRPEACCWCLTGAVFKCYEEFERVSIITRIHSKLNYTPIGVFNDTHTHAEVLALVEKLDI